MTVKIVDPSTDPRWDDLVSVHKYGSIYHQSAWKEVIETTYGYTPLYFVHEGDEGKLKGGLPFFLIKSRITGTRLVSLPFSDFCGPLAGTQEDLNMLVSAAVAAKEQLRASYVEIRTCRNPAIFSEYRMKEHTQYCNHVLALDDDAQALRKSFHKSCIQRSIKKAESSKICIKIGRTEKDMRTFYDLHTLTRRKHGLPVQPYAFFYNMWTLMYPKNLICLLLAEEGKRAIAGVVLFRFKDTMYFEYGGSDGRYLENRPNHLLLWRAIEMACNEGLKYFDFGRTSVDNGGLMAFKSRWGAEEHPLHYFFLPDVRGMSATKRTGLMYIIFTKIGQRMPSSILRLGGRVFYKHLG